VDSFCGEVLVCVCLAYCFEISFFFRSVSSLFFFHIRKLKNASLLTAEMALKFLWMEVLVCLFVDFEDFLFFVFFFLKD